MKLTHVLILIFVFIVHAMSGQSIDDAISISKMKKDLALFKDIRQRANSGLYTYRTEYQIDSVYNWANHAIEESKSYRDFYNILCQLTDYEGSCHNSTYFPTKLFKATQQETWGYFPIPVKVLESKVVVNIVDKTLPLGSEILSVNGIAIEQLLADFRKYYTTDGYNLSGKSIGITKNFSLYYRYAYGLQNTFEVRYRLPNQKEIQNKVLTSTSYKKYFDLFSQRHSYPMDCLFYQEPDESTQYSLTKLDSKTAVLTLNTFSLGGALSESHLQYKRFIDSVFTDLNTKDYKNLILDIRNNGGGNPPNDMLTLSYLTHTSQKEIADAWIGFTGSIPYWNKVQLEIPFYLKPIAKGKIQRYIRSELPVIKDSKRYYSAIKTYEPNPNAFKGTVYLLVSEAVASAASLFAAMVSSNTDAIVIGQETMGGYYGHNGAFSLEYKLPRSNFSFDFSIVNLTQQVKQNERQLKGRGVMPDFKVTQSFSDFMNNQDTQLNFVEELIRTKASMPL